MLQFLFNSHLNSDLVNIADLTFSRHSFKHYRLKNQRLFVNRWSKNRVKNVSQRAKIPLLHYCQNTL